MGGNDGIPSRPVGANDNLSTNQTSKSPRDLAPTHPDDFDHNLPKTVTLLHGPNGAKVYLVGTAHFSLESQEDVSKVIRAVQPNIVVVELCPSRLSILKFDEETIEREAKNLSFEKMVSIIKSNGVLQGVLNILLLNVSATFTKKLGMAPGGEFRRAFQEVKKLQNNCMLHFGDRPIQVTLKRALDVLTWTQSIRLTANLLFSADISAEEVEKYKEMDLLESMLKDVSEDFPALGEVFIKERDIYLTYSLQLAASRQFIDQNQIEVPTVVVGIVGIGHIPGIKKFWNTVVEEDVQAVMKHKEKSKFGKVFKRTLFVSVICFTGWQVYKRSDKVHALFTSLASKIKSLT